MDKASRRRPNSSPLAGVEKVFREIASGATTDSVEWRKALDRLDAGGVLIVQVD
jgi:hypothetical protein